MHLGIRREDLPGIPLYSIHISEPRDQLKRGAHLVYQVCGKPYRPCYRSALVVGVDGTSINVIMNSNEGVVTQGIWLNYFEDFNIVVYSHCHYTDDEAVERAEQRLKWGEKCYDCLNNNSHHFVTWAKTGRENPLADIIESLTCSNGMRDLFIYFFVQSTSRAGGSIFFKLVLPW